MQSITRLRAAPLCIVHKCINALLSLTTDFVWAAPCVQAMHIVSQDFAASPANNFSLSIPPSFPYGRMAYIRTIMDLQHSSPLKHHQTLFLKLNWHDLPQTTSSDEKEVLHVWKDFNSREEELSNTQSATAHGWAKGEPSNTQSSYMRKHLMDGSKEKTRFIENMSLTAQNCAKGKVQQRK